MKKWFMIKRNINDHDRTKEGGLSRNQIMSVKEVNSVFRNKLINVPYSILL